MKNKFPFWQELAIIFKLGRRFFMSTLRKELLKEMIHDGNLKTAGDLQSYLKDLFKDTLQEMLETELDMDLGYSKGDRKNKDTDNRRNGHTQKTPRTRCLIVD